MPSILAVLLCALTLQADPERVWRDFLDWYKQRPEPTLPVDSPAEWAKDLARSGVAEAEVKERVDLVLRMVRQRTEARTIFFNKVYSAPSKWFVDKPNALLASLVETLPPGRALDVAMGQGRNTIFLAQKGWEATGFDLAETGLEVARQTASKAGLKIEVVQGDVAGFDYGADAWNLIVMTYAFAPVGDPAYLERIRRALKPDGLVLFEATHDGSGPPNGLIRAFLGFRILHYEDVKSKPEWEQGGRDVRVLRLVAAKL
jgi:2-polyprenyl-3-methyl-5-hydroxy-6-metoxy-1,4-benzoquinol methylase